MGINKAKFPKPSVWASFELETEFIDPPEIRLKLRPILQKDTVIRLLPYVVKGADIDDREVQAAFDSTVSLIMDKVLDWDLKLDGELIPCNTEMKTWYLEPLLWERVKIEEDETPDKKPKKTNAWLWYKVLKFASDLNNFVKN